MKRFFTIVLVLFIIMITGASAAIDFTGWKQIEVNESQINSSSTTVYTVMIPPGMTETTKDSPVGAATFLSNESNPASTYAIYVMDTPSGTRLDNETATMFLNNFMTGADITPVAEEPAILSDGVMTYGTQGDNAAGIYLISTDQKVSIITGFYKTMDDAAAGKEDLAMIAGTITVDSVEST